MYTRDGNIKCDKKYLSEEEIHEADDQIIAEIGNVEINETAPFPDEIQYGITLHSSQPQQKPLQIEYYSNEIKTFKGGSINLDEFWFEHMNSCPDLTEFALRFLLPPASSTSVERQFSCAGRIVDKRRSRLASSKVKDLVIIAGNRDIAEEMIE